MFGVCRPFLLSNACFDLATHGLQVARLSQALHVVNISYRAGPTKTVVLYDDDGFEEEVEFDGQSHFERWAETNPLLMPTEHGRMRYVCLWEQLEDGGRYRMESYTSRDLQSAAIAMVGEGGGQ